MWVRCALNADAVLDHRGGGESHVVRDRLGLEGNDLHRRDGHAGRKGHGLGEERHLGPPRREVGRAASEGDRRSIALPVQLQAAGLVPKLLFDRGSGE
jgi:hypothetical protein